MARTVMCVLFKEEGEGLDRVPYPGELGQRIFDNVSKKGWSEWLAHQTMIINENRWTPINPEHRKRIEREMSEFFFGIGVAKPDGYVPPSD